ncbi:MAG: hypothetical protein RL076_2531 [Chloroflexota bacterium]|jgi:hypothetical protein
MNHYTHNQRQFPIYHCTYDRWLPRLLSGQLDVGVDVGEQRP